jgi:Fic family protein
MRRDATGSYQEIRVAGETVRAFVPAPLPPTPPLDLGGARQALLERASLALGRLDSVGQLLPDPQLFLYAYVRREAVLSSQIEGTQSSLSDLMLFELDEVPGVPIDDVVEVSNYVAALDHGMARLRGGFPLSNRLLREMHATLMAGAHGSQKAPGEFRHSQNWLGGVRPSLAHFVPPPPGEVEPCMAALENFMHGRSAGGLVLEPMPTLIKAALAHVQFETIHPFLDGNGRLGRLMIALLLHEGGALAEPLLYLSLYLKRHRSIYYEQLDRVRSDGDWEGWVDFFLEGVEETARSAVETAQRLATLFRQDIETTQAAGRGATSALRLLTALRERPVSNLGRLSEQSGMSFPTASKAMGTLVDLGVARELTGKRRNRVFVYDTYLGILSEEEEPE